MHGNYSLPEEQRNKTTSAAGALLPRSRAGRTISVAQQRHTPQAPGVAKFESTRIGHGRLLSKASAPEGGARAPEERPRAAERARPLALRSAGGFCMNSFMPGLAMEGDSSLNSGLTSLCVSLTMGAAFKV